MLKRVRSNLRVTKVVATRSVKGKYGDSYVGFSASWDSVQEDGGQGILSTGGEDDESRSETAMSLQEAIVSSCVLSREADLAAYRNAMAGGNISVDAYRAAVKTIRQNYSKAIVQMLGVEEGSSDGLQPPSSSVASD